MSIATSLHSYRLLAARRGRREPAVPVGLFAADDGIELFLDGLGNHAHSALAYFDFVDRSDGSNLCGGAGEERLVANVEHFARNHLLDERNAEILGDLHHGIASNAGQNRVAERRRDQLLAMHDEY